jgi:hypothetical protein
MKLHYKDTEISYVPMLRPEIEHWLGRGYALFQHRNIWWLKIQHHRGHRVLIQADAHEVRQLLAKPHYEQRGCTIRIKEQYAYSK